MLINFNPDNKFKLIKNPHLSITILSITNNNNILEVTIKVEHIINSITNINVVKTIKLSYTQKYRSKYVFDKYELKINQYNNDNLILKTIFGLNWI